MGITVSVDELRARLEELCPAERIDLAGVVSLPCELPLAGKFRRWLADGHHGDLEYMLRDPERRLRPVLDQGPGGTLLVFAQGYTRGWHPDDTDPSATGRGDPRAPWTAAVARYARGEDYHDILLKAIKGVLRGLRGRWPDLTAHASCDTGPYLEREYAWLAGLGFLGKNTCLIHEKLGSGLFLGVALTNLELEDVVATDPDGRPRTEPLYGVVPRHRRRMTTAYLSACGRCTRCIDACPTGALGPDGGLDAGACISNWTIEQQGRVPPDRVVETGGILFGCDICQAVCPWNHRAAERDLQPVRAEYDILPGHHQVRLADLAAMDAREFRQLFRHTPLWRCHPEGMRRNAARVLAFRAARGSQGGK